MAVAILGLVGSIGLGFVSAVTGSSGASGPRIALIELSGEITDSGSQSGLSRTPGAAELTIFCGAMTGASPGFLWYNAHPAEVFMGDVGSLALGGGPGVAALLLIQALLQLFIGCACGVESRPGIMQRRSS